MWIGLEIQKIKKIVFEKVLKKSMTLKPEYWYDLTALGVCKSVFSIDIQYSLLSIESNRAWHLFIGDGQKQRITPFLMYFPGQNAWFPVENYPNTATQDNHNFNYSCTVFPISTNDSMSP